MNSSLKNIAYVAMAAAMVGCSRQKEESLDAKLPSAPIMQEEKAVFAPVDISALLAQGIKPSQIVSNHGVSYADLSAFVRDAYNSDNLGSGLVEKVPSENWQMIVDKADMALKILNDPSLKQSLEQSARSLHSDLYIQKARGESRLIGKSSNYDSVHRDLFEAILHAKDDAVRGGYDHNAEASALRMMESLSYKHGTTKSFNTVMNEYTAADQQTLKSRMSAMSSKAKKNYGL
jgi:hypothetical protein